jgi:hypothetical protein
MPQLLFITPCACAGDKVIGRVVVVAGTNIATSWDLGTWATRKHNESIRFGKKLALVCFKSRDTVHKRHKQCLFVGHCSHAYRQCLLGAQCMQAMNFLLMHITKWPSMCTGKDVLNNARDMLCCLPIIWLLAIHWLKCEAVWNQN